MGANVALLQTFIRTNDCHVWTHDWHNVKIVFNPWECFNPYWESADGWGTGSMSYRIIHNISPSNHKYTHYREYDVNELYEYSHQLNSSFLFTTHDLTIRMNWLWYTSKVWQTLNIFWCSIASPWANRVHSTQDIPILAVHSVHMHYHHRLPPFL